MVADITITEPMAEEMPVKVAMATEQAMPILVAPADQASRAVLQDPRLGMVAEARRAEALVAQQVLLAQMAVAQAPLTVVVP